MTASRTDGRPLATRALGVAVHALTGIALNGVAWILLGLEIAVPRLHRAAGEGLATG